MRHAPSLRGLRFGKLCVCSALLAWCAQVQALDLLQAYQAAKMQDPTMLAARAVAAAERERLPQARSQLLPSVVASVSYNKNRLSSTSTNLLGLDQTTDTDYPSSNKALTLRQPLFRSQLAAQVRQAQSQVADAESVLAVEEQNLAVRVSGAFFEAMLSRDQLDLVLSQQVAYKTHLDAAKKALAAGFGTRTDIDDAQTRLDMGTAMEIEARQHVTYTLSHLQTLTNQSIDTLATLNVAKLVPRNPEPDDYLDWVRRAEDNNPEIHALKARVETARQEVEKARAGHLPTLDATAQWTQSDSESVTNTSNRYTNRSIGVQLNVPLYAGGYVDASIRQTLAALERAEQIVQAGRRDLSLRVHKEYRGVTESIAKIRALEQALKSADQSVLSSKKSVQAGSRTTLDVLNAEQQRLTVLRDLAQTRYTYLVSRIRLLALAGEPTEAAIADTNLVLQN